MNILKQFLANPLGGFQQGLAISEVFKNRERQKRLMELKAQAQGIDAQNAQTNAGQLDRQRQSDVWHERQGDARVRQTDEEIAHNRNVLDQRKREHADVIPNEEKKAAIAKKKEFEVLVRKFGLQKALAIFKANQDADLNALKLGQKNQAELDQEKAMRDAGYDINRNAAVNSLISSEKLYDEEPTTSDVGRSVARDNYNRAFPSARPSQPQQSPAVNSNPGAKAQLLKLIEAGAITTDMARADPGLRSLLEVNGIRLAE